MSVSNFNKPNFLKINCNNLECNTRIVTGSFVEYNKINNSYEASFETAPKPIEVGEIDFATYPLEITFTHFNSSLLIKYYGMLQTSLSATGKILIDVLILNKRNNISTRIRNAIGGYLHTFYLKNQSEVVISFNEIISVSSVLQLIDGDVLEVSLLVTNTTSGVILYDSPFSPMIRSLTEILGVTTPFFVDEAPQP